MADIKQSAAAIIKELSAADRTVAVGVVDGIDVEAAIDKEKLVFQHRLDAFSRPTKQEALEILTRLNDYINELYHASEAFREFVGNRRFAAELCVYSGQMDFTVATMDKQGVQWHVNLDE